MLDHPFFHTLATDPRNTVRNLYNSEQTQFYELAEIQRIIESNQATFLDETLYYQSTTNKILKGEAPSKLQFDDPLSLMARGHHLRLNDVLSITVNTLLARMMDSGLVAKIMGKYYMTDGKWLELQSVSYMGEPH